MSQARGSCSKVVIDYETTYGADPASPAGLIMPFNSFALKADRPFKESGTITGTRNPVMPARGNLNVSGSAVVPVDQIAFGYWLKALLGAPDTDGSGPYTHVFSVGSCSAGIPSMVADLGFPDIAQYLKFNGVKLNSLSFTTGGDDELTASLEFIGAKETTGSSPYDATASDLTFSRFNNFQATLKEGGSTLANAQEIAINISNQLDDSSYVIGGNGIRASLPERVVKIEGTLKTFFEDLTLYTKAIAGTESSLELTFTSGTYSLKFAIDELQYQHSGPVLDTNGGIYVTLPFVGYYEDGADETAIKATLVNGYASYA